MSAPKLTPDDAQEIRRLYLKGISQSTIAIRFKVSTFTVWAVIRGEHWTVRGEPNLVGSGGRKWQHLNGSF